MRTCIAFLCLLGTLVARAGSACATMPEGHRRMLAELERLRAETLHTAHPFLGENQIGQLEADLAALPAGVPDPRRWQFNGLLATHLLRLGRVEPAVEHQLAAYRELSGLAGKISLDDALRTIFDLGVAYLRLGETQNCAQRHTPDSCTLPIRSEGVHELKHGSGQALRYFTEVLEHAPPDALIAIKARWLLNIAAMTLGRWPEGVPAPWRIEEKTFASDEPFPRFVNIAGEMGMTGMDRLNLAGGAVAEDYDGDLDLDLVLSSNDTGGPMTYWRNDRGKFVDATAEANLRGFFGGLNMIHADYDNDGDVDIYVLRGGWWREFGRHPDSLLRNDGKGAFTDVTYDAGLAEPAYPSQTGAFGDFDLDGDLDLYVGNEFSDKVRAPAQLFRNNGDGTFTDIAPAAGVENNRFAKAVVWGDYDGDRYPDLYVSNMGSENRLYRNNGDGTFTDVAPKLGVTSPISSFPAWWFDVDNDGALDIAVFGYGGGNRLDAGDLAASYLGLPSKAELPHLYRNDGKGGFHNVAAEYGLRRVSFPMGSNFGDLDNDGWLDVYLGTGQPFYEGLMPNVMYHNEGGRGFADVTTGGGFGNLQKGHGVVFADFDNDGDQDVFEEMGGAYPGDAYVNLFFENPGFGHHWIKVRATGRRSNRSGIGTRIRIEVVENGKPRSIYKWVNSGGSFGANPLRQEIGIGSATRIDKLEVYWPASDTTQVFRDVAVDQAVEVVEGEKTLRTLPLKRYELGGAEEAAAGVPGQFLFAKAHDPLGAVVERVLQEGQDPAVLRTRRPASPERAPGIPAGVEVSHPRPDVAERRRR